MNSKIPDDELNALIENAKRGDTHSFGIIVRSYQKYGLAVSFRILCSEEDAKDVVQEGFIRIWKNLNNYDRRFRFTTWIYKIFVNLCFDKLKSDKRNRFEGNFDENDFTNPFDFEEDYSNRETASLIRYISKNLSDKQKIIFILRDIEGFSVKETSEITGMNTSSVKTNLLFARRNIRRKINGIIK